MTTPDLTFKRLLLAIREQSATRVRQLLDQGGRDHLLAQGAALDQVDGLVLVAVHHGRPDVLTVLLQAGLDPNQPGTVTEGAQASAMITPLNLAVARDEMTLLDRLLDDERTDVNRLVRGQSALRRAAALGHLGMVNRLLEAGADPMRLDLTAMTRNLAIEAACEQGEVAVVERLLDVTPSVLNRPSALEHGPTLLMQAAWYGHASLVTLLLNRGADPERVDGQGRTVMARTLLQIDNHLSPSGGPPQAVLAVLVKAERQVLEGSMAHTALVPSTDLPRTRL